MIDEEKNLPIVLGSEIDLTSSNSKDLERSIEAINGPLSKMLSQLGLPIEDVLASTIERQKALCNLPAVLDVLDENQKANASYISKFTLSIVIGLFDGAFVYIWNETIKSLRKHVIEYDLPYFFQIASNIAGRYKGLNSVEDISLISDYHLLEVCTRMGIISDVNHERFRHIIFLRNHASSAHPNEEDISGYEMVSSLENCLNYAVLAKPDGSAQSIKILLNNMRTQVIPQEDYSAIEKGFEEHIIDRRDDFLKAIFGQYLCRNSSETLKNNIIGLAPCFWAHVSEDAKYHVGMKYGFYKVNGAVREKELTQQFLNRVDGNKYKDDGSIAAELMDVLGDLLSVHNSFNNFYNEFPYAEKTYTILEGRAIPESIRKYLVKTIVICHIGNGMGHYEGVDRRADPYYVNIIEMFRDNEIVEFLRLLDDTELMGVMHNDKPQERFINLCIRLQNQAIRKEVKDVLDYLVKFPPISIHKVASGADFKRLMKMV